MAYFRYDATLQDKDYSGTDDEALIEGEDLDDESASSGEEELDEAEEEGV